MSWTVPALTDCAPDIEPVEFKVLVAPAEKARMTAGGIHLPEASAAKEDFAHEKGRLIALSPMAFTYAEWPEGARKPQVGDVVHFGRYAGALVEGADQREYRLMSDRDIGAILQRGA